MNIIEVYGPGMRNIENFVLQLDPSIRAEAFRFLLRREFGPEITDGPQEVTPSLGRKPVSPPREVAPQELLRQIEAKTMMEVAPVLAYWLEIYQGETTFSSGRLKEAFDQAREAPPANPSDLVAKLEASGKLMKAEKAGAVQQYRLTRTAIDEIESRIGTDRPASNTPKSAPLVISNQDGISARAAQWMGQFGISRMELDNVFSLQGDSVDFIAASVPGESKRQQTIQAYLMCGLQTFIQKGEFAFRDADARVLCERLGCLDARNHAAITQKFGNLLSGSKEAGWKLTNPGLTECAKIVKALGKVI
jgi:hypothetical protein